MWFLMSISILKLIDIMSKYLLVLDDSSKIFLFSADEDDSSNCLDSVVSNLDNDVRFKGKNMERLLPE